MRAYHKYRGSHNPEHKRRVAQSIGYRGGLTEQPLMVALLQRAGILPEYAEESIGVSSDESAPRIHADTTTIKL